MEIKFNTNNYALLSFKGIGDGVTSMLPQFDINLIKNKIITIKSFKVYYYNGEADSVVGAILFQWVSPESGDHQNVLNLTGGNIRIPDFYKELVGFVPNPFARRSIQLTLNNNLLDCFPFSELPNQFKLDNILIQFPNAIQSIDLKIAAAQYIDYNTPDPAIPFVYAFIEVYKQDPFKQNIELQKL